MKKFKICHIGWANSIHVERWLKWFSKKGHEMHLITDIPKEIEGVKIYNINERFSNKSRLERYKECHFNFQSKPLYNLNRIFKIRNIVKEISPDIVHTHSLWYPGYLGVYLNFHPYVITVFNGDVLWKKDRLSLFEKLRTKLALRKSDLVTGVSNELVNAALKHGAKNGCVIRRGVDLKKFKAGKDKETVRKELTLPLDKKIILSPRNIGDFYNLKTIVEIVPDIISKYKDVLFVFIWHSPEEGTDLKTLACKLGVMGSIKFIGKVSHDQVALYHKSADVMISISDKDSGPVALQEAMAAGGVPVISDLVCVRELVNDGENGFLVNPKDKNQIVIAVLKLLQDDDLRNKMKEYNLKIAIDKCDEEKEMEKMERLYYKLTGEYQDDRYPRDDN